MKHPPKKTSTLLENTISLFSTDTKYDDTSAIICSAKVYNMEMRFEYKYEHEVWISFFHNRIFNLQKIFSFNNQIVIFFKKIFKDFIVHPLNFIYRKKYEDKWWYMINFSGDTLILISKPPLLCKDFFLQFREVYPKDAGRMNKWEWHLKLHITSFHLPCKKEVLFLQAVFAFVVMNR